MRDLNKVFLAGRLGLDPAQRSTKSGITVMNLRLATSYRTKNQGGEAGEQTQWHNIVVWGKTAEIVFPLLKKGDPVWITGTLRTRNYEGKDGITRMTCEVHADDVYLMRARGRATSASSEAVPESEMEESVA